MALRNRDIVSAVTDRENLIARPGKLVQRLLPRPALDEVGNRLKKAQEEAKKPEPSKDLKKKPSIKENAAPKAKDPAGKATKAFSSQQLDRIIDPDADTKDDSQMVTEYVNDIYQYLRELEVKYPIRERFLEGHQSTPRMRTILVNWLVQVHSNFKLCLETLYLCVSIIDRYLQDNKNVGRENLQLVGAAALMIACKYEEIYSPELSDFVYICDDTFTKRQILRMEKEILKKLGFDLCRPLSIHFLRRYSKIAQVELKHHSLSKYMLELALLDNNLCHIKPSIQAAAACCLSLSILNDVACPSKVWTPTLVHYTTYKYVDFKEVVIILAKMIINAESSKHQSIRSKYAAANLGKISTNPKLRGSLVRKLAETTPRS